MDECLPGFRRTQFAFAAYIRDPANTPIPTGVAPARMDMYRELFFNNIENFIATGFPVLKAILTEQRWGDLIQDFYSRHRSKTPFFAEIAQEFLDYLREERGEYREDPSFLLELAHYEWVELALAIAEGEPPATSDPGGESLLSRTIGLSQVAWPLAYRFPVHRIGPEFQPEQAPDQPTFLVVYRDRNDVVRFMEVNPPAYRLLQLLQENGPMQAEACLRRIAEELQHPDPPQVLAFGAEMLRGFCERGLIGRLP